MNDLIRQRFRERFATISRGMSDTHDQLHGPDRGWNHYEEEPCHSVCVLMGELVLLLGEMEVGRN